LVSISHERLTTLFRQFNGKRIAVIGDLMLDRYVWGIVSRISPEAPVPVVEVEAESVRLGGAANVANNIASLGGKPLMIGVVGDDDGGKLFRQSVDEQQFSTEGLVVDPSRKTTVKTRVIAHNQHVVRIDREVKNDIEAGIQQKLLNVLASHADAIDGIIIEDYNKGVLVQDFIHRIVSFAATHKKIITVDPKFNNFFEYKNVTVFKPNRNETEEALGAHLKTTDDVRKAGGELLKRTKAENVLMTLGEQGMMLFERDGEISHVPTKARRVADVSGAGDTVIATLTVALSSGATVKEAAALANFAGGIVCGEVGIVPIDKQVLFDAFLTDGQ
jgi:rfaE bifunctional protein kinase chain/domain